MILNYYGVDWLAMVLTFLSLYLLGKKRRSGFLYGLGANACWFTFGILAGSMANQVANVVFAALNVRGYRRWARSEAQNGSSQDDG